MKLRRFKRGVCNHVYQRTIDRFNIFYDTIDYLVYFTIFCVCASKYKVIVRGLCLMIDHIHMLVTSDSREVLSKFISNVTSVFVREYNSSLNRKGPLFEKRFGSAPKVDKKRLMSSHPFSAPMPDKVSENLETALGVIDWCHASGKYLNHALLQNLWKKLSDQEQRQLADYIIVKYNVIDYVGLKSYFGSYEQMVLSMQSTTGSEYDLKEYTDKSSDVIYQEMIRSISENIAGMCRKVIILPVDMKRELFRYLKTYTGATSVQIRKFLHMKVNNLHL